MMFKAVFLVSTALTPVLAAVASRDLSTVLADVQTIDPDFRKLLDDCNNWTNPMNGTQVVRFAADFAQTTRDIRQATTDCSNTAAAGVTAAQAQAIINYYNNPLSPDVKNCVNCYIARKSVTENPRFNPAVRNILYQEWQYLQGNLTLFHNCLLSKIPASPATLKPSATSIVNKVNTDVASAVNAYSTP